MHLNGKASRWCQLYSGLCCERTIKAHKCCSLILYLLSGKQERILSHQLQQFSSITMRNRGIFLLQIIAIFLLSTKSALAIKCYNCDSSKNVECYDVSSSNTILPETCTPQILSSTDPNASSWLQKLIRIEFLSQSSYNVAMLCQKISVVNERDPNDRIIVRSCQLDGAQTNPCSVAEDKIRDQQIRGYRIDHCSICNRDNCNGAMRLATMWPLMGILLAMVISAGVHLW